MELSYSQQESFDNAEILCWNHSLEMYEGFDFILGFCSARNKGKQCFFCQHFCYGFDLELGVFFVSVVGCDILGISIGVEAPLRRT